MPHWLAVLFECWPLLALLLGLILGPLIRGPRRNNPTTKKKGPN